MPSLVFRFQSTLLMRGATLKAGENDDGDCISIHAPHARSDGQKFELGYFDTIISIHAPHARSDTGRELHAIVTGVFQSTLLMRGATHSSFNAVLIAKFQSTLLMRGATFQASRRSQRIADFNPRSSCEERRPRASSQTSGLRFQSTLLMRGATWSPADISLSD